MRLLPKSLFGRLVLVLTSGLVLAQLLSAALSLAERDSLLVRASGMRPAQRIADIVQVLDAATPAERAHILALFRTAPLVVTLGGSALPEDGQAATGAHEAIFAAVLRAALGDDRPVRVRVSGDPAPSGPGRGRGGAFGRGPGPPGTGGLGMDETGMGGMMSPGMGFGMHRLAAGSMSMTAELPLRDGTLVTFRTELGDNAIGVPWQLLTSLLLVLAAVLVLSFVAVRWVTRPLDVLTRAADELGRDIRRPPLPEQGPAEVSRAAHAFNTMQRRLAQIIEDRARIFTAMSHDLKTPITRMRLRAEMLDDDNLREKFEKDLLEMQDMVTETLDYLRGLSHRDPEQAVDVMALLESIQSDYQDMGRRVSVRGAASHPVRGVAALLRRCVANLVDNAVLYGKQAEIEVEEHSGELVIRVRDDGPGLPPDALEKAFDPFYRVEASRNRETGGTGLGLSIARDIAQAHGGDIRLRNRPTGGLEAILTLPSGPSVRPRSPVPTTAATD